MSDRPWSDTDWELVADVLSENYLEAWGHEAVAGEVLDALTAAGWRPTAPTAEEIAVATEAASYAVAPLIAARAVEPYRDRIEALEALLACYRIGKPPSGALHRRLELTRTAIAHATTEEET